MRGEGKVAAQHVGRTALIYVRQSTMAQVREHTESTARQYALAEEAARLGWPASSIDVIDADLGVSGRSTEGRDGFKGLVARVCLGEVGAIFGLEVSRLARSSADLSRLLEYARLTDTLVIDGDGVYDLAEFNDRLLLGLKGTMSEAELHLLAGRLQGAKRAAAERGELRTPLPVGYVYDDEGTVVIDPDEEVAGAIADVFTAFTVTGSAYQVATPDCRSVRAATVDDVVAAAVLAAVAPDRLALALAAADEVTTRRDRSRRAAELTVERARYAAERAERAYGACEPENRLVARSLEARWEACLVELARAEAALAAARQTQPPLPPAEELAAAVADLGGPHHR